MFLRWLTVSLATGLRAKAMLGMSPEAQSTKCRKGEAMSGTLDPSRWR